MITANLKKAKRILVAEDYSRLLSIAERNHKEIKNDMVRLDMETDIDGVTLGQSWAQYFKKASSWYNSLGFSKAYIVEYVNVGLQYAVWLLVDSTGNIKFDVASIYEISEGDTDPKDMSKFKKAENMPSDLEGVKNYFISMVGKGRGPGAITMGGLQKSPMYKFLKF